MRKIIVSLAIGAISILSLNSAMSQTPISSVEGLLFPTSTPTSADNITLSVRDRCAGPFRLPGTPYRVAMATNNITVTIGYIEPAICPTGLIQPNFEYDLGRLPAGSYTVTVITAAATYGTFSVPGEVLINKAPFTVIDARESKAKPYVRLDYSGHWWDPTDPGWGLFVWHDTTSPTDSVFAAWFSYTPDGKPMWYVFQPKWTTYSFTTEAELLQTSRAPGAAIPPSGPTTNTVVGTAALDFTNVGTINEGKLVYTFTNGTKQVRNIRRFRP